MVELGADGMPDEREMTEHALTPTQNLYLEVFATVRDHLSGASADNGQITRAVQHVIQEFERERYSDVLLHSYTSSAGNYLLAHITNIVILSVGFGHFLKLSSEDLQSLGICAFCHDFGMSEYTQVFQKSQLLADNEARLVQAHPMKSVERFKDAFPAKVLQAIQDVHEQVDGQGYPHQKKALEISPLARIVSLCDAFEALTHPRSFRTEFNPYEAVKMIIKKKDTVYDGQLINYFVEFMSIYPIGAIVLLNSGETGMVVRANAGFPTRPWLRLLLNAKREILSAPASINLLREEMLYVTGAVPATEEKEIVNHLNPRGCLDV